MSGYGVTYFPYAGILAGTEVAWWYSYGNPQLWGTYQEAAVYLNQRLNRWLENMDPKVVSASRALACTIETVEVFSGRRKVQGSLRPVVNDSRPTYEMLRERIKLWAPLSSGKLNLAPEPPLPPPVEPRAFTPRLKKIRT